VGNRLAKLKQNGNGSSGNSGSGHGRGHHSNITMLASRINISMGRERFLVPQK